MLDAKEIQIIAYLKESRGLSLAQLSKALSLNRSTIYYILCSLISKKLVTKIILSPRKIIFALASHDYLLRYIEKEKKGLEGILFAKKKVKKEANKRKLVFSDSYRLEKSDLKKLEERYDIVTFDKSPRYLSDDLFLSRCHDAEIVVNHISIKFTKKLLSACKRLKTIVSPTIDNYNIDYAAARQMNINVMLLSPTSEYNKGAFTEFVFAQLFALLRRTREASRDVLLGKLDYRNYLGDELRGKRIGIVGAKKEGKYLFQLLRLFGCEIHIAPQDNIESRPEDFSLSRFFSLGELFSNSDILIFPEEYTRPLDITSWLQKNCTVRYLILNCNSVRYNIDVLRVLLLKKRLLGVAIDYFPELIEEEKGLVDTEYRKIMYLPNVLVTPQIDFYTRQSIERNRKEVFSILESL